MNVSYSKVDPAILPRLALKKHVQHAPDAPGLSFIKGLSTVRETLGFTIIILEVEISSSFQGYGSFGI